MRRDIVIGLAALAWLMVLSAAHAAAGRTAGAFSVDSSGNAIYVIPIWVPPGPNHLQPNIQLLYNSSVGTGYVGVGWTLSGISSISRCNRTVAQDGAASSVALYVGDALCLDGQRLQLTSASGTQGLDGSTYQTEIANSLNITAHGSAGNGGPAYFVVKSPNGNQYEYGNTASSAVLASGNPVVSSWMLDKVTDTAGNTMTVSYVSATGTTVPQTISWTPTSAGSPNYQYTMQFTYGTNVPQGSVSGYVAGTAFTNTKLLQSVGITYTPSGGGTSTIKQYNLAYSTSPVTQRNELVSVTECADSTTANCLSPTTFAYQSTTFGISTAATTTVTQTPSATPPFPWVNYDFNGDGIPDILYSSGGHAFVAFGTPGGYSAGVDTGIASSIAGDLLGTHHDGLLAQNGTNYYYYTWNGSTFTGVNTGVAADATASSVALVDVDGDGKADLVTAYSYVSPANPTHITTRLNTSSGGALSFGAAVAAFTDTGGGSTDTVVAPVSFPGGPKAWDFNGDTREDLFVYGFNYACNPICNFTVVAKELLAQSNGTFTAVSVPFASSINYTNYAPFQFLSWNNDKCTDIAWANQVYLSGCNGTIATAVTLSGNLLAAMDVDGDGRKDAIINSGGTLAVQTSTGVGVNPPVALGIPYSAGLIYGRVDVGGTGLDALWTVSQTTGVISYYARNSPGTIPDVLTSATDGFGNSATPTYFSITQGTGNNYSVTNTTPPESTDAAFTGPSYIVGQVRFSDPSATGASYTQTHYYTNAWQNLQGRGFLGFTTQQMVDSRYAGNPLSETWTYNMVFPTTGMVISDVTAQNSGAGPVVSSMTATPATVSLNSTPGAQRFLPYISSQILTRYEVGGTKNGQLISTEALTYGTPDIYGNSPGVSSTTTDNDISAPASPTAGQTWTTAIANQFEPPDTTNWCVNLLEQTTITKSSSVGATVTQVTQYAPDPVSATCREKVLTYVAQSGSDYNVTETRSFDGFGNISSVAMAGAFSGSPRSTITNWGATGQLPMSLTDASGVQTQINYDFRYGRVSTVTDPNVLTNTTTYGDGFGRKTLDQRPDGTSTSYTYSDCAGSSCLIGSHGMVVNYTVLNTDQSVLSAGVNYLDSAGRPLIQTSTMLNGGVSRTEVRYDSLGRLAQHAAPCVWSGVATPCPYWSTNSYDLINRLTQTQRPTSAGGGLSTTTYNYRGRTATIQDPDGNVTTLVNDVNGWLRKTTDASAAQYSVTLNYDAAGNKASVTDSTGAQLWSGTYIYGIHPFLSGETDRYRGAWIYNSSDGLNSIDALGERIRWTDAKGQRFSATYDALSRPTTRSEPDLFTTWSWGTGLVNGVAAYNVGKLQGVCTGTGPTPSVIPTSPPTACGPNGTSTPGYSESESYDALGRLSSRAITIPGDSTYTYGFGYNQISGLPDTMTYPTTPAGPPLKLQYHYNSGQMQSVTDVSDVPNIVLWTANLQNFRGQITQETLGNQVVVNHAFDAVTGLPANITAGNPTAPGGATGLQNESFLFDAAGNLDQRTDNNRGFTENIYLDADNRLDHTVVNGNVDMQMSYNPNGSINTRQFTAAPPNTNDYLSPNSLVAESSNALAGGTVTWTSFNQPGIISGAGSTSSTLLYDYNHQRWQQRASYSGSAETTTYIGGFLEKVVTSSTTLYRHLIPLGNGTAIYLPASPTPTIRYMTGDHLGSTATITDNSGNLLLEESFTPWGARRDPANWAASQSATDAAILGSFTRHGFTGHEHLDNLDLVNMNGRMYQGSGFISPDPQAQDPADSQLYNPYVYVRNNPLTLVDPTGFADSPLAQVLVTGSHLGWCGEAAPVCSLIYEVQHDWVTATNAMVLVVPPGGAALGASSTCASQYVCAPPQTQCTVLQKIGGSIQNALADAWNGKTLSFGYDFVASDASNVQYSYSNFAINTNGQFIRSFGDSTNMNGLAVGVILGVGGGVSQNSNMGPVPAGRTTGTATVGFGGFAAVDEGILVVMSKDNDSKGVSLPDVIPHASYTVGLGGGGAMGQVATTTTATAPKIGSIPYSSCHL